MSERVPSTFQGAHEVLDAVSFFVGGLIYEGWEDVQITRELNAIASDFTLQVTDKWRADKEKWELAAGQAVHIHVGKQSVLTGYIDKLTTSVSASARSITVEGRSKTGDLVDCSLEGPSQYNQSLTLKDIAEKVLAPFGIQVIFLTDPGASFVSTTVQNGETVFAFLDRLARERKILMFPSYEGSLIFTAPGIRSASAGLTEGVNILSARGAHDFANRFSKYSVKGQNLGAAGEALQITGVLGEATDAGVSRYRPLIVMAENDVSDSTGGNRAAYEASLRAAKSQTADIEVQGWFQSPGRLWEVNELVSVDCGSVGLKRRMLVQKVVFNKSNAGTRTVLSVIRQDAYNFKKTVKKEDPLAWTRFVK